MERRCLGSRFGDDRGAALIITLFIVALVTIVVLEYHFDAAVEIELADNAARDVQAYYLAMSGLNFAKVILQKDDASSDAFSELWATLAMFGCMSPKQLLALSRDFTAGVVRQEDEEEKPVLETVDSGQGCVSLNIVDEARKLPLNALVDRTSDTVNETWRQIFQTFFEDLEINTDASDPVDALIDWIDVSPGHLEGGGEDDYYATLERPYQTPDRPIEVPGELALVRHFDCDMLAKLFPGRECKDLVFVDLGSNEYLTPYSGADNAARINLNTANEGVLHALTGRDSTCMEDILEKRLIVEGQLFSEAITNVESLSSCQAIPAFATVAGVASEYFRIESVGMVGDVQKRVVAVLKRGTATPEVVYFKVE